VFRLYDGGTAAVNVLSIAIRGTDRAQFQLVNHCGSEIVAGTSCEVAVTFKPTSAGFKVARLRVELVGGTVLWRKVSGTGVVL